MTPIALRLLAVYFISAAGFLWLAHRFVRSLRLRVAVLIGLAPLLLTGEALVTAGVYAPIDISYGGEPLESYRGETGIFQTRTPILSDVVYSHIPSRKAVREAVRRGQLPLWNRFHMSGEPLLAFLQPATLHPVTWIGFLLPLAQAWTFEMAVRLLLAALAAYLFLRDLELGEIASLAGAAAWAFSDHLVFYLGYPVTQALGPFPLLLLGLRRLAREPDRRAVAITVASLALVTLGGHPESLLHTVGGAGLYFLFELGRAPAPLRSMRLSLLAGVLALGLVAAALLPFFEILPHTQVYSSRLQILPTASRSSPVVQSLRLGVRHAAPYAYGVWGHSRLGEGYGMPTSYDGSLLWPLAVLGLASTRREKWAFLGFLLLGLTVGCRVVGIADLVGSLPLFRISIIEYLQFLASFGLAALAAIGLDRITRGEGRATFATAVVLAAVAITLLYIWGRPTALALGMPQTYLSRRFALQLVPLLAAAAAVPLLARFRSVAGATVLVILLGARGLEAGEVYPTYSARAFYPAVEVLQPLGNAATGRVAARGFNFVPNMSAMYELEDARGYEALALAAYVDTYPLWCAEQAVWYNRVDDPTRPFLAFLGVRWMLQDHRQPAPEGWRLVADGKGGRLYENPRALPKAFVPQSICFVRDPKRQVQVLAQVTDFGIAGVVDRPDDSLPESSDWQKNGRARATVVRDEGQALTVHVVAQEPTVVATSIPRWPGWKATLDGRDAPLVGYNRAFLAFRVPPGQHEATLRYRPDGFSRGLAVSAASLLASLILWRLARPRGSTLPRRFRLSQRPQPKPETP